MSDEQPLTEEVFHKVEEIFSQEVASCVRKLLEEKHLYQSVRVSKEQLQLRIDPNVDGIDPSKASSTSAGIAEDLLKGFWIAANPAEQVTLYRPPPTKVFEKVFFQIVSIQAKCGFCGAVSPMNLLKTTDALSDIRGRTDFTVEADRSVFSFTFQCQSCRDGVEVFVVARQGDKLTLVGRSPMETVDVPQFIPKEFRNNYSGALVAFNSGQVLPAIFMLRTLIEQFMRSVAGSESVSVDDVIESYMETLPMDFKSRFPSFKDVYRTLSDVMHRADDQAETEFQNARAAIERHFDARRVYEL